MKKREERITDNLNSCCFGMKKRNTFLEIFVVF